MQKGDRKTVGRPPLRWLSQQKMEKKKKVRTVGIAYLSLVGDFPDL